MTGNCAIAAADEDILLLLRRKTRRQTPKYKKLRAGGNKAKASHPRHAISPDLSIKAIAPLSDNGQIFSLTACRQQPCLRPKRSVAASQRAKGGSSRTSQAGLFTFGGLSHPAQGRAACLPHPAKCKAQINSVNLIHSMVDFLPRGKSSNSLLQIMFFTGSLAIKKAAGKSGTSNNKAKLQTIRHAPPFSLSPRAKRLKTLPGAYGE